MNKISKKIKKRNHNFEYFDEQKYRRSLKHAGVPQKDTEEIVSKIKDKKELCESTSSLHRETTRKISKFSKVLAANYNIKNAIYKLGPTGFPFEILSSEMLKAKGFKTTVSVIKKGKYVNHEVDVIAIRDDITIYFECKYHKHKHYKNDIQIPLYINSRYLDIKEGNPNKEFRYGIISNTQFSRDAITYSNGVGLLLYSMNYPKENNFIDLIQRYKVYPITVLNSLKLSERRLLLDKKIVVVKQITRSCLKEIGLEEEKINKVLKEVKILTIPT